jgi:hypothetical protein
MRCEVNRLAGCLIASAAFVESPPRLGCAYWRGGTSYAVQKILESIFGFAFLLGPIWDFIKWCLDWRGRVDALAATYHDIGGYHVMIAYLLNPPSWLYPPFMFAGLALIWWNLRRPKKANLNVSAQNGDLPPGTIVSLDGSRPTHPQRRDDRSR